MHPERAQQGTRATRLRAQQRGDYGLCADPPGEKDGHLRESEQEPRLRRLNMFLPFI